MEHEALSVDYSNGTLTLGFSHNDNVTYPFEQSFTKLDLNGNVLLSKKINTPERNGIEKFLAPVADGGFVAAFGNKDNYLPNASITRFDATGKSVFSKEFTKSGWQLMSCVKSLSDGTFAMAGDNAAFITSRVRQN